MSLGLHHLTYVLHQRTSSVFMVESHIHENHKTPRSFARSRQGKFVWTVQIERQSGNGN